MTLIASDGPITGLQAVILSVRPRGADLAQMPAGQKDPAAERLWPGRGSGRDAEAANRPHSREMRMNGTGFRPLVWPRR